MFRLQNSRPSSGKHIKIRKTKGIQYENVYWWHVWVSPVLSTSQNVLKTELPCAMDAYLLK